LDKYGGAKKAKDDTGQAESTPVQRNVVTGNENGSDTQQVAGGGPAGAEKPLTAEEKVKLQAMLQAFAARVGVAMAKAVTSMTATPKAEGEGENASADGGADWDAALATLSAGVLSCVIPRVELVAANIALDTDPSVENAFAPFIEYVVEQLPHLAHSGPE